MDKVGRFFKRIEVSYKMQIIFFCVCMSTLIVIYIMSIKLLKRQFEIVNDDYTWMYQIDSMEERDGKLQIEGWAFALNLDAEPENFEIVLYNTETEKKIFPKMFHKSRMDVNDYFLCEYNYTESGFTATLPISKLDDSVYEVLLHPKGENRAFTTGVYYTDGKMTFVHPDEFASVLLSFAGTDLETIVENGVLRVYRPDFGMYVFQNEGELYWIADQHYGFVNNNSCVEFHMNTTQVERLPEERLANGWKWSDMSFMFCENELTEWNTGQYRVTKCALPKDYSIVQIWTGNYINDWIWLQYFRPWYEFE